MQYLGLIIISLIIANSHALAPSCSLGAKMTMAYMPASINYHSGEDIAFNVCAPYLDVS